MGVVRKAGTAVPSMKDYASDDDAYEVENEEEMAERTSIVQSGWAAMRKAAASSSGGDYVTDFRFSEDPALVKFLSSEPVAVYKQHWINERAGRKSFTCAGAKCPLCNKVGHKPQQKARAGSPSGKAA